MTLREMIAYTLYYRDMAFYWRFVRFDVEYKGWLEAAMHLPKHKVNTVRYSTN